MPIAHIPLKDIEQVFNAWKTYAERPSVCRLREDRKKMIRARMRLGYTAQELVDVIDYIHKADEDDCKWMRGQNPRRRKYLGLDNILRVERLAGRVEAAAIWRQDHEEGSPEHADSNPWEIC